MVGNDDDDDDDDDEVLSACAAAAVLPCSSDARGRGISERNITSSMARCLDTVPGQSVTKT